MADFKSKDEIGRQQLKNFLLKRVIIRFDFTSIVNLQTVLDNMARYLQSLDQSFGSLDQMFAPPEEVFQYESDGLRKDDRPMIFRFSDSRIEPIQEVSLDLSRNYLCLDIHCNERYTLIDRYLDLMSELMSIIIGIDSYVQLTRLGIRKIDGVDKIDPNDADNVFEYFTQQLPWGADDAMQARNYTDYMLCRDIPAYVTYRRIVRFVPGSTDLRFTLDIDCYKESTLLEKRPDCELLKTHLWSMNDKLFELFKMGIRLEYFRRNV